MIDTRKLLGENNVKQQVADELRTHYLRWRCILEKSDTEANVLKDELSRRELGKRSFCSQLAFLLVKLPNVAIQLPPEKSLQIGVEDVVRSLKRKNLQNVETTEAVRAVYALFDRALKSTNQPPN